MFRQIVLSLFAISFALGANGAPISIPWSEHSHENRDFLEHATKDVASVWNKATSKIGHMFHHSTSLPSGFVQTVTTTAGHTYTVITSTGGPAITLTKGKHGEVTSFAGHKFTVVRPTPTITPTFTKATTHTVTHTPSSSALTATTTPTGVSSSSAATSSSTATASTTTSSTSSGSTTPSSTTSTGFPTSTFFKNSAPAGARAQSANTIIPMLASLAVVLSGAVVGTFFAF